MTLDAQAVVQQIDDILAHVKQLTSTSKFADLSDLTDNVAGEAATLLSHTIQRFASPGSSYAKNIGQSTVYPGPEGFRRSINALAGVLRALRLSYARGYLLSINELVHADVFGDFLDMAEHLLEAGYKDPAAVISGSVLEEHLRKLSTKNGVDILRPDAAPKKADALNAELSANDVYSKLDQKNVTAWLDLRNKAAHGHYGEYTKDQVSLMLQSVRDFAARHPA